MRESPLPLTALCLAGGLLAAAAFLVGVPHSGIARLLVPASCLIVGYAGMLWSGILLRRGVRQDRWPAHTLVPLRRLVEAAPWSIAQVLLFVVLLAALIPRTSPHRRWFWVVFVLLQTQAQLTMAFARPRDPAAPHTLFAWKPRLPLRSSHWGER